MATGFSAAVAAEILDALCNADAWSVSEVWIKLHVGDPGAAGTSSPATETTRKQASFAAASSGTITTDGALTWTSLPTGDPDDYTHFTAWTASSGGSFLFSGTITANAVQDGDTFTIPAGELDLTLAVAS